MQNNDLRHLSRLELIDIIYELQKQREQLTAELERTQAALNEKTLCLANAGSIAEAALGVNKIFETAQAAADQYLLSIQAAANASQAKLDEAARQRQDMLDEAELQRRSILQNAEDEAAKRVADAEKQADEKWAHFEKRAQDLIDAHAELQAIFKRGN